MTNRSRTDHASPRQTRRRFSAEFKAEAVRLLRERQRAGDSAAQVARELGIAPGLLWEWADRLEGSRAAEGPPAGETLEQEVRRLRRENATLRLEREFAKKAAAFFARESL
jgi:transposase